MLKKYIFTTEILIIFNNIDAFASLFKQMDNVFCISRKNVP